MHGLCLFQEHTPFHDSLYPQRVGPDQHGLGGDRWGACGEGVLPVLEARSRRKLDQCRGAPWCMRACSPGGKGSPGCGLDHESE